MSGIEADFSDIPLPPEGAEGEARAPAKAEAPAAKETADLRFLDARAMSASVTFDHPFQWRGRNYHGVTARRLTFAEVAALFETHKAADGTLDLIEVYAAMVSLPAAVLRGMEAGDTQKVIDACHPLLPRTLLPSTSPTGGA